MELSKATRVSLLKALSKCSLRELPEKYDGEDVWIKALALVVKATGEECFVSLTKDPKTLTDKISNDFGGTGVVIKYKSIHPYLYLSDDFMPKFNDKSKESRAAYLHKMDPATDWSKKTLKELNNAIIGIAIKLQLNNINSNTHYIDDYGDNDTETESRRFEDQDSSEQ